MESTDACVILMVLKSYSKSMIRCNFTIQDQELLSQQKDPDYDQAMELNLICPTQAECQAVGRCTTRSEVWALSLTASAKSKPGPLIGIRTILKSIQLLKKSKRRARVSKSSWLRLVGVDSRSKKIRPNSLLSEVRTICYENRSSKKILLLQVLEIQMASKRKRLKSCKTGLTF